VQLQVAPGLQAFKKIEAVERGCQGGGDLRGAGLDVASVKSHHCDSGLTPSSVNAVIHSFLLGGLKQPEIPVKVLHHDQPVACAKITRCPPCLFKVTTDVIQRLSI